MNINVNIQYILLLLFTFIQHCQHMIHLNNKSRIITNQLINRPMTITCVLSPWKCPVVTGERVQCPTCNFPTRAVESMVLTALNLVLFLLLVLGGSPVCTPQKKVGGRRISSCLHSHPQQHSKLSKPVQKSSLTMARVTKRAINRQLFTINIFNISTTAVRDY